ncbi:MAG: hypothetical protein HYZ14_15340 [Bacteroidetes bacterium]|nr:hypothetical protein [Bacteroidota bacterium]
MSYKHNIIKERFDIAVTTADTVFKGEFELDKNAEHLFGLLLTSDSELHLYYRGSQKIQVNDQELFPEDFEAKLLMSGLGVSPNQRVVRIGNVKRGNGKVEVWFKDTSHPSATPFTPYKVILYLFSTVKA